MYRFCLLSYVLCYFEAFKGVRTFNKVKTRSNRKLTPNDEKWIIHKVKENPRISAPKINTELKIYLETEFSDSKVTRVLCKNKLHEWTARLNSLLSVKQGEGYVKVWGCISTDPVGNLVFTTKYEPVWPHRYSQRKFHTKCWENVNLSFTRTTTLNTVYLMHGHVHPIIAQKY